MGWARQPGLRTVQGEVERALSTLLRRPVEVTAAGRTDRGVHAWGQVVSYDGEPAPLRGLNALLPEAIDARAAESAPDGFDARRDALSRTYCYRVLARSAPSPFEHGRALWWPHEVDREALANCAAALPGTHDFTAFTPTQTEHRALRAGGPRRPLGGSRRGAGVLDRGGRLHAPHEPRARRDDARGGGGAEGPRRLRGPAGGPTPPRGRPNRASARALLRARSLLRHRWVTTTLRDA